MSKCAICDDYILTNEDVKAVTNGVAHIQCVEDARKDGEYFDEDDGGDQDE